MKTVALAPTIYTIVPPNIPFQRHNMGWKCYYRAAKDPEFLRDGFDSNYNCVFDGLSKNGSTENSPLGGTTLSMPGC